MLDPKAETFYWLGAEAIPSGLHEIDGTRRTWADARTGVGGSSAPRPRPAGLIAIAARWLHDASRLR